jgi:hypothetical protein
MKIKVRSDDAGLLQDDGWPQMADWLAELRDDDRAGLPGNGHAGGDGADGPWPAALAQAGARAEARVPARAAAKAEARARADAADCTGAIERAVIGDQLRMPVIWCEMGSCISWYADPAALGEADTRARAIGAGWRVDALGRLACRRCQQTDPCFWASRPVVPWDRPTAIARAAAVPGDDAAGSAGSAGSRDPGRPASAAADPAVSRWQRQYPQVR